MNIQLFKSTLKEGQTHAEYTVNDGVISFRNNGIDRGIDEGRKIYLRYTTGWEMIVPEGYIAIIAPSANFEATSLYQPSVLIKHAGRHSVEAIFKVETTAIPAIIPEKETTLYVHMLPVATIAEVTVVEESMVDVTEDTDLGERTINMAEAKVEVEQAA